jgi:hypothetical protein
MPYSPSPPILTLGKLWYDLQDIDPAIAYVSEALSRPDPDPPPRPEVLERFRIIREKRKELLGELIEKKRNMILEAMECERQRHDITMTEMQKLLDSTSGGEEEALLPRMSNISDGAGYLASTREERDGGVQGTDDVVGTSGKASGSPVFSAFRTQEHFASSQQPDSQESGGFHQADGRCGIGRGTTSFPYGSSVAVAIS